jgi:hypothetical protein
MVRFHKKEKMIIELTDEQLNSAIEIAKKRHEAKNMSFRNKRISSSEETLFGLPKEYSPHIIGAIGEMAWSIASNEPMDEQIYKVRDSGRDFSSGVDVKTITYSGTGEPELKIQLKEYERKTPTKYILAHFDMKRTVNLLGQITREDFDVKKKKRKYGAGKPMNYIIPLSLMEKI